MTQPVYEFHPLGLLLEKDGDAVRRYRVDDALYGVLPNEIAISEALYDDMYAICNALTKAVNDESPALYNHHLDAVGHGDDVYEIHIFMPNPQAFALFKSFKHWLGAA